MPPHINCDIHIHVIFGKKPVTRFSFLGVDWIIFEGENRVLRHAEALYTYQPTVRVFLYSEISSLSTVIYTTFPIQQQSPKIICHPAKKQVPKKSLSPFPSFGTEVDEQIQCKKAVQDFSMYIYKILFMDWSLRYGAMAVTTVPLY